MNAEAALSAWAAEHRPGPVWLATSGGGDSSLLARLAVPVLRERGHRPALLHVRHGLRGEESDGDARFVVSLAAELGCPVRVVEGALDPELVRRVGLEAAARARRLAAFEGAGGPVLTAHHQDDQVETILLRREQGVPADRAAGMPERRGSLHRPWLGIPRARLRALALELGRPWREDSSNRDLRFERNRIRRGPAARLDPRGRRRLLRAGASAREVLDAHGEAAQALVARAVRPAGEGEVRLDAAPLLRAEPEVALLALRRATPPVRSGDRPPGRRALTALLDAARRGGASRRVDLGAGWSARVEGGELHLRPAGANREPMPEPVPLPVGGEVEWLGRHLGAIGIPVDRARRLLSRPDAGRAFAVFDRAGLPGPLIVAPAPAGARFRPYGLDGTRPVRHIYIDARVPRSLRAARPTVQDARGMLLWLPGLRSAQVAPLGPDSDEALLLYTLRSPEGGPIAPRSLLHAESP